MTQDHHGRPCWYELTTDAPADAGAFYAPLLGWTMQVVSMEGFDYHLASVDEIMVAGMAPPQAAGIPPHWLIYLAVTDCDATAAAVVVDGGRQIAPPADIPGTGRFAILADPQGAMFGILQPLPDGQGGAFDQSRRGHGNWHELMTADPVAAMAFYGKHFGWAETGVVDMGPMGAYHLFGGGAGDLGGMMGLLDPAMPPSWVPYFGVPSVGAAQGAVLAGGGQVLHGPDEVPGGAMTLQAADPAGACFAVTGPR